MDMFVQGLTYPVIAIRIIAAIIIGGIIGYEREVNNRPAGFRTHILVCLGAAIISLIQDGLRLNVLMLVANDPNAAAAIKVDVARLGAQVVSGIGFLGAGSIMRERGTVGGLTTAASIWATGCIGIAIGWGFYHITLVAAVAVIITLITLKKLEISWIAKKYLAKIYVEYKEGLSIEYILRVSEEMKALGIAVVGMKKLEEEGAAVFQVRLKTKKQLTDALMAIATHTEVENVRKED